jgi:hypothetical protein
VGSRVAQHNFPFPVEVGVDMGFREVRGCGREPFTQLREIPLPFHSRTHGTVPLRVRLRHAPTSGSVFESRAGHGVQAEGACNWLRPVCVSVARVSGGTWVRSDCFVSKSSSALPVALDPPGKKGKLSKFHT